MGCVGSAHGRELLTPRAVIETTRFMTDRNGEAVVVSPDGQQYVVMLITGDAARDGVWVELRVGRLDAIEHARPKRVVQLFTHARGGGYERHGGSEVLLHPGRNVPRWIDNDRVVFLWEDRSLLRQVVSVAVDTGELRYLTSHRSDVTHFNVRSDGTLLYGAKIPCARRQAASERSDGHVVDANDAFELIYGCGAWDRDEEALYVMQTHQGVARQVAMQGGDPVNRSQPLMPHALFSPSGRHAVFANTVSALRPEWARYTAEHFRTMWHSYEAGGTDNSYASQFQQLFVINVATASARPLWPAPNEPYARYRVAWAPDERHVVVGPTFLPVAISDEAGLAGEAVAVVNVESAHAEVLPVAAEIARRIQQLRWLSASEIELRLDDGCRRYRRRGRWIEMPEQGCEEAQSKAHAAIEVRVEQGLNDPPRLVARDRATGREVLVLDPNPQLSRYALGKVEWVDKPVTGARWNGRLYYPADYEPGRHYPLVIQTHSMAGPGEYSLTSRGGHSPGLGPGHSAYLAQALASRGFFVLHGRIKGAAISADLLKQTGQEIAATEEIVEGLVRDGRVDRNRVGIMGYSASGWNVSYALAHSSFPYAAALTDDNKDGSYSQALLSGWRIGLGEEMIGVQPFADGLTRWLDESPAFRAHLIRTPLLMSSTTPGSELGAWELFSRLRFLQKPVEFYLVPDFAHGSHGLQNPTQLLGLQQRALDWWCFWLNGEEDADPQKASQYERWRILKGFRDSELRARGTNPGA